MKKQTRQEGIMNKIIIMTILLGICSLLSATIWEINQDGSGDFITIQAGIDTAANGDTLLIYPGTYYENLLIEEKYLTLGSLYLTTGDESYVSQTILDGNQTDSVIRIESVPSPAEVAIIGFVIQNGIGYERDPNFFYEKRYGGGLYLENAIVTMTKNIVQDNRTRSGGGIHLHENVTLNLSGNTIRYNHAFLQAGGILILTNSQVNFCNDNLNNVYLNYASLGNDISISHFSPSHDIVLDTFTVIEPEENYYYIYPTSGGAGIPQPGLFTFSCQNAKLEQVEHDLYVAPDGSNANSGASANEPLQSIAHALAKIRSDSLTKRTIHVADGVYSATETGEYFPLHPKTNVDIIGESRDGTILDCENETGQFYNSDPQNNYSVKNMSFIKAYYANVRISQNSGVSFDNIYITDNDIRPGVASFHISFTDLELSNLLIENNLFTASVVYYTPKNGFIFNVSNSIMRNNNPSEVTNMQIACHRAPTVNDSLTVNLVNLEITNNYSAAYEWLPTTTAIDLDFDTKANVVNCTIGDNESLNTGAALNVRGSRANLVNTILYGNIPYEIYMDSRSDPAILNAKHSLVEGGQSNILLAGGSNNTINWDDDSMLDEDPLWQGEGAEHPYALTEDSPCINAGTLDLPYGVQLPAYDLAGNPRVSGSAIDMGAYEFAGNAAPIDVQIEDTTLSWRIPAGHYPPSFNVYLDHALHATITDWEYTFEGLLPGETYIAGVSALYEDEETAIIPLIFSYDPVFSNEELPELPELTLSNYPNPFNPETTIRLELPEKGEVELTIYNIRGQKVKKLIDAHLPPGIFESSWNGRDDNGRSVASGHYFIKLKHNGEVMVEKMMLVK